MGEISISTPCYEYPKEKLSLRLLFGYVLHMWTLTKW